MSVFTRGTASRSRVRTVLGGIAIAGASALVLAGCAGGGGGGEPSERRTRRGPHPQDRHGPAADRQPRLPRPARGGRRRPRRRRGQRGRDTGVTSTRSLRRLGRHRQQGVRDHDPEAAERGRLRHDRRRIVGCHQAVPRQRRRRGHHHVLAGQHVARLHHVGRQRPVLAHRSLRHCCRARCSAT